MSTTVSHPPDGSLAERYQHMPHAFERRRSDALLRALDIGLSGVALAVVSPLLVLIVAAIRVLAGSPVLYRGARVGRFGRVFAMYKFRTLRSGAEGRLGNLYGEELTTRTVEEMTAIGRLLRATYLDELPQLWNVLRGDMSIVGPRPIRPAFFQEISDAMPQYWQRLVVRPGVTGLAQTRVTREDSWAFKLAHDLEYIADRSPSLYLTVIGITARHALSGDRHAAGGSTPRA